MLCAYFGDRYIGQISSPAVETFKRDRLKTPVSIRKADRERRPRAVNSELTTLSAIFDLAMTHKLIRENPCSKVKRLPYEEGPCRRLSAEEGKQLLAAAEFEHPFLKPMIQLAIWTGLRQGELIALTKGAIDFSRNRLLVLHTKWRKDKRKTEGNPVSEEVRSLLSSLCQEAKGELLFTDKEGQRLTRYEVDGAFRRACANAGVTGLRFHDLRHEYGSRLGDADVNLKKIARLMGHSNTKQTERYLHPDDDGLLKATTVTSTSEPARILQGRLRKVK